MYFYSSFGYGQVTAVKSSNYVTTPVDGLIPVDVTGGPVTITFETSPAGNQVHTVKNYAGNAAVAPIIVNGGGVSIEDPTNLTNYASQVSLDTQGAIVTWIYVAAVNKWVVLAAS